MLVHKVFYWQVEAWNSKQTPRTSVQRHWVALWHTCRNTYTVKSLQKLVRGIDSSLRKSFIPPLQTIMCLLRQSKRIQYFLLIVHVTDCSVLKMSNAHCFWSVKIYLLAENYKNSHIFKIVLKCISLQLYIFEVCIIVFFFYLSHVIIRDVQEQGREHWSQKRRV